MPRIKETQNYVAAITADYERQLQLSGASGGGIPRARRHVGRRVGGLATTRRARVWRPARVRRQRGRVDGPLRACDFREHGNGAELAGLAARDAKEHGDMAELASLRARDEREYGGAPQNFNFLKLPQYDTRNNLIGYQAIDPTKDLPVIQHSLQSFLALVGPVKVELKNVAREGTGAAQGAQAEADALAAAFGDLPPLINAAGAEAKAAEKDFEQTAQAIAGVFGDSFTDSITRGPVEGFKTMRREFASLILGIARDWFESKLFKSLTGDKSSAGGGILARIFGGGSAQPTAPFNPTSSIPSVASVLTFIGHNLADYAPPLIGTPTSATTQATQSSGMQHHPARHQASNRHGHEHRVERS